MTDRALARMSGELGQLYAATGRPSIAPERQLMEPLDYNLLFRWFVGLEMDDEVGDVPVFTKNRERLIGGAVSQQWLAAGLAEAREKQWLSAEHFTVDGTLIRAWAAGRSFQEKSDPPAPGAGSGHGGEVLLRDKVESKTDPEARLYKKATADKSVPSYLGHALMENRHGLVVAAQASPSATAAEREVALVLLDRVVKPQDQRASEPEITLGADTQYQDQKFIEALRERAVAPHVSEYTKGVANLGKNALNEWERADARRPISQQKRKLIERVFGWAKQDRPIKQIKLRGLPRVDWFFRLVVTAYNLLRLGRLRLIPAEVG